MFGQNGLEVGFPNVQELTWHFRNERGFLKDIPGNF